MVTLYTEHVLDRGQNSGVTEQDETVANWALCRAQATADFLTRLGYDLSNLPEDLDVEAILLDMPVAP